MISRFMSSEKSLPQQPNQAQRPADFYDLLAWFEVNRKRVITVALVLVVIGFVIATVRYTREQKELNASSKLLAMRVVLTPPTNTAPAQASELQKVAQEFSGTSAAERARLLAATTFYTEGKYADAEREFSAFLRDFQGSPWAATAAYGIATAQEAQGKPDAVAAYQSVATKYANSPVAANAKLALGRIHETQKQPEQALRIYNELLTPRPGAQPGEPTNPEAEARKEALMRKDPQLNTNAPASTATAPVAAPTGPTLQIPSPTLTPATTETSTNK